MSLGNWSEDAMLDWLLGGATPTRPSGRYVSLHSADPGETGANELSATGYSRKAASFTAASGGASSNSGALSWSNTSGSAWPAATHFGVWDAASGGNFLGGGALTQGGAIAAGGSGEFAAGELDVTLD